MKDNFNEKKAIGDSIALEILTSGKKLPPLPSHGAKLLEMALQPIDQIDITSFAKLMEVDPGLFASLIQLANSPYYMGLEKIISPRAAITRIGLTETINSICLYFFQKTLPEIPSFEGFSSKSYWVYSWACATANRRLGHPNLKMGVLPGELYLAGLLHGVGKLLLAIHYPNEFNKCLKIAKDLKQPLYKIEQEIFGTVDTFVASKIMKTWNLPDNICAGVAFYNIPESAPIEYQDIAGCTQLAYNITAELKFGDNGDGLIMDIPSTYICQEPDLPISQKEVQEELIQEILTSLGKRTESVTGVPFKTPQQTLVKTNKSDKPAAKKSPRMKSKKKGFFAAIKSLFFKN